MGLFDPLRRTVGLATEAELASARADKARMNASEDPCDRFGAAFANLIHHLDAKEATAQSKAVRDSDIKWPSSPHLRWQAAARIGRQYGQDLIGKRLARVNDPALARAVNARALGDAAKEMNVRTYNPGARTSIEDVLRDKGEEIANGVHALISFGRTAEINARAQSNALKYVPNPEVEQRLERDVAEFMPGPNDANREEWLMEAIRTRMVMAQKGLLSPAATVDAAMDARQITLMQVGAISVIRRTEAEQASPEERRAMFEAAKRETFILAYGAADPKNANARDSALLGNHQQVARPAVHAAMAAQRVATIS